MPYWNDKIKPEVQSGKKILVVAHGNSLRALVKYLDKVSDKEIVKMNIPTGIPLVYNINKGMITKNHYYLGNQDEINKKHQEKSQWLSITFI